MTSSTGLEVKLTTTEEHQAPVQCPHSPSINEVQLKKNNPFWAFFSSKVAMCIFQFHFLELTI